MEIGRSRRWRRGLCDVQFLSPAGQGQPAFQCVLGRELHRLRRVGLVGLPGGGAADHLGRGRRAVLCRCGLGARHARVPAAKVRRHSHSAVGGPGRILCRRLARRVHLDPGPDVRSDRQAGCRFLPGTPAVADAVQRRRIVPGSAAPGPQPQQFELRGPRQYARFGVGHGGLLLPQLQQLRRRSTVCPPARRINRSCFSRYTTGSGRRAAR